MVMFSIPLVFWLYVPLLYCCDVVSTECYEILYILCPCDPKCCLKSQKQEQEINQREPTVIEEIVIPPNEAATVEVPSVVEVSRIFPDLGTEISEPAPPPY